MDCVLWIVFCCRFVDLKKSLISKREVLDFICELFEVAAAQFHYAILRIQQNKLYNIAKLQQMCIDSEDTEEILNSANANNEELSDMMKFMAQLNRAFHGYTKKILISFINCDSKIFENCIDALNVFLFLVCFCIICFHGIHLTCLYFPLSYFDFI